MLPIFVGVTGHRVMSNASVSFAQDAVRRELRNLRRRFPATPLILVSALAEGADRLVAKVALECGLALWAVLPTSIDEYARDFQSDASKAEFHELLGQASRSVNAALQAGRGEHSAQRPEIYVDVAHEICRMSHLLIALWDGGTDEKPGGTSQVLRLFRTGDFPDANPSGIGYPDCGPVLHIAVSRDESVQAVQAVHWLAPCPGVIHKPLLPGRMVGGREHFERCAASLDAFNARCSRVTADTHQAARQLLPAGFAWQGDALIFQWISWFCQAEAVSNVASVFRRRNLILIVLFFVLFSLSTLAYGGLVMEAWPLLLGALTLAAALASYGAHRLNDIEEAWVGGRAVAESLRVAIIWRITGCQKAVHHVASEEGIFPFDWIGMALRAIDAGRNAEGVSLDTPSDARASVLGFWCESQQDYFVDGSNKIAHHDRRARRYARASGACVIMAMLVYLLTMLIDLHFPGEDRSEALSVTVWTMYMYWTLLSLGAVVASYSQIIGHADHEADYRFALVKFRMADQLLKKSTAGVRPELVVNLGQAALRETISWLKLHRGRPLRLLF